MVVLAVAEGKSSLDGRTGWRLHEPRVRDISIGRTGENSAVDDSLDVAALGVLEQQLQKRDDEWPSVDFKSAVTMTPSSWMPGDVVRFTFWIENVGKRDAERAWVSVLIGVAPSDGQESIEIRREWFPRVAANGRVAFDVSARLPRGDAMVHLSVRPGPTMKRVVETNPGDNDTSTVVGLDLVAPKIR
jgi:hypothetical protein